MFAIGISMLLAGALGYEFYNYRNYKSMLSFMSKKKYYERDIDVEWIKDVMENRMDKEGLENWIRNSISYRETDNQSYYKEVPLENLSHKKMLKWVAYYLYYKSLWQLSDEQLLEAEEMLDKIENILGIKFEGTEDDNVYFLKFGSNRIESSYKPLVYYGTLSIVKNYAYSYLKYYGFEQYQTPTIDSSKD